MVTLLRGSAWKVSVYGREHGKPHFHVEGPGFRCSLAIETLEMIVGGAPAPVLRAVRAWAAEYRDELNAQWKELNP
ncbi:MAG: DUF4160 domain-containing protein [Caulobacteraceae bacterium]